MALQQPPTHSEDASGVTEVRRRKGGNRLYHLIIHRIYTIIVMWRPTQVAAEYGSEMLAAIKRRVRPFFFSFSFSFLFFFNFIDRSIS